MDKKLIPRMIQTRFVIGAGEDVPCDLPMTKCANNTNASSSSINETAGTPAFIKYSAIELHTR
jgi:hypothetical protein